MLYSVCTVKTKHSHIHIPHDTHSPPTCTTTQVAILAPSAVAKAGVAKLPFFGAFATALQSLFVERKGFDKSNNAAVRTGGASLLAQRAADARYVFVVCGCVGRGGCKWLCVHACQSVSGMMMLFGAHALCVV